jgi:hypothetical protein
MPLEWPSNVPGPRPRKQRKAAKKARGSSGKGNGTTVGMSVLIFGLTAFVIFGSFATVVYLRFVA